MTRQRRRHPIPNTKISETFLAFAEPILLTMPPNHTIHHVEKGLRLAYTIWNSVVWADATGADGFLADLRARTAHDSAITAFIEDLISRKRTIFGADERVIGQWCVSKTTDGFNLRAEAKDPHSLPSPTPSA